MAGDPCPGFFATAAMNTHGHVHTTDDQLKGLAVGRWKSGNASDPIIVSGFAVGKHARVPQGGTWAEQEASLTGSGIAHRPNEKRWCIRPDVTCITHARPIPEEL